MQRVGCPPPPPKNSHEADELMILKDTFFLAGKSVQLALGDFLQRVSGLLLQENRSATCEAEEPSILLRLEKAVFAAPWSSSQNVHN